MTEAQKVVDLAKSWIGKNEKDGSYKSIIDIYNSYPNRPRKIKMDYGWAWCACTWSALAIKLGYTDIMPIEISCGELIKQAQKMGIWIEDDFIEPQVGDAVLYDWDDDGKKDCTGWPDHVGVVDYVNTTSGYFTVIEGNYSDSVKKRTVSINGRYIRGFIRPKYDILALTNLDFNEREGASVREIALEVIAGKWLTGDARKMLLQSAGYNPAEVQKEVNKILNGEAKNITNKYTSTCKARLNSDKYNGSFVTTSDLYLRNDAGTNKKALTIIPKNTIVSCSGQYTMVGNIPWLLVRYKMNEGITYTGFSCGKYLNKVN